MQYTTHSGAWLDCNECEVYPRQSPNCSERRAAASALERRVGGGARPRGPAATSLYAAVSIVILFALSPSLNSVIHPFSYPSSFFFVILISISLSSFLIFSASRSSAWKALHLVSSSSFFFSQFVSVCSTGFVCFFSCSFRSCSRLVLHRIYCRSCCYVVLFFLAYFPLLPASLCVCVFLSGRRESKHLEASLLFLTISHSLTLPPIMHSQCMLSRVYLYEYKSLLRNCVCALFSRTKPSNQFWLINDKRQGH